MGEKRVTPSSIEEARANTIREDLDDLAKMQVEQAKAVEEIAFMLLANKEHFGGIAIVCMARHDTALVDTESLEGANAIVRVKCLDNSYRAMVNNAIRDITNPSPFGGF